ncbi:hypothetical protein [Pontibacter sp. G13]|uniref:hypothetical protein n=1 Tax=Pontibacter sp. G13 TaxID=3074898 RepID=UPI00288B4A91|nr:hypothetical protein [Pontibacter sp. G13]WNJ17193.1 hypothetical protein RJD25_20245 [Pontibacter sp. G13]
MKQVIFYLRISDLINGLELINSAKSFVLVTAGLRDYALPEFHEINEIKSVTTGDWNLNHKYLLVPSKDSVNIRNVPQKKGGIKYAIDLKENREACVLIPSGIWQSDNVIAGKIGILEKSDFNESILGSFESFLKNNHLRKKGIYVSSSLSKGLRLVTSISQPTVYDLKY